MKLIEIPVKQIVVGERRRADLGDIAALAKGIRRVGLLEPIIVDRAAEKGQYRLVSGERRLRAVRLLRSEMIAATLRENLSDAELRDIELEENENRKSLTETERRKTFRASKQLTENAKKAGKIILQSGCKKDSRGRKPKGEAPRRQIAEALGTSRETLRKAEQHVDLAERYPWLQSEGWRQADVLRLNKHLQRISEGEHGELFQFMERAAAPLDPRVDRVIEYAEIMSVKTPKERSEIYQLSHSADERDQALARTRALHRPPMPDVRARHIHEALEWLQKAVKPPYDREPEAADFTAVITRLKQLNETIRARYEAFKQKEAQHVEEDIRRQAAISA